MASFNCEIEYQKGKKTVTQKMVLQGPHQVGEPKSESVQDAYWHAELLASKVKGKVVKLEEVEPETPLPPLTPLPPEFSDGGVLKQLDEKRKD